MIMRIQSPRGSRASSRGLLIDCPGLTLPLLPPILHRLDEYIRLIEVGTSYRCIESRQKKKFKIKSTVFLPFSFNDIHLATIGSCSHSPHTSTGLHCYISTLTTLPLPSSSFQTTTFIFTFMHRIILAFTTSEQFILTSLHSSLSRLVVVFDMSQ